MEKTKAVIATLLLLLGGVSAWGPATHRHICDKAVEQVWGEGVVKQCLPRKSSDFMNDFCDVVYIMKDAEAYTKCRESYTKKNFIHPANMPHEMFNDTALFHDYTHCPIKFGPARLILCGGEDDAPAPREAQRWFNKSRAASDTCMRVYLFCVGSTFFAEAENPLNQVKWVKQECYDSIVNGVEEKIVAGTGYFTVRNKCTFDRADYKLDVAISEKRIQDIVYSLSEIGKNISEAPSKEGTKVVLLANSIDAALNKEFYGYMNSEGLSVVQATADTFKTLKYSKRVILLGGHHAPEGVGGIVETILNPKEKEELLKSSSSEIKVLRKDVWMVDQKVWVLAGYEKEETQDAVKEYGKSIVEEIKSGL